MKTFIRTNICVFCLSILAACGGGGSGSAPSSASSGGGAPPPSTYSVGGVTSGLSGTVVLQDNSGDNLSITSNGNFVFVTALKTGTSYSVTVLTQPTGQTCQVTSGTGTIASANISNISVVCSSNYSIGGTVNGLAGGNLTLQNNNGASLQISTNGKFTFGAQLPSGAAYKVTVQNQPIGLNCVASNSSGVVGNVNVTDVNVNCSKVGVLSFNFPATTAALVTQTWPYLPAPGTLALDGQYIGGPFHQEDLKY